MIKANSLFNNKFCFNINFEDIIERLSITCSVKKKDDVQLKVCFI